MAREMNAVGMTDHAFSCAAFFAAKTAEDLFLAWRVKRRNIL
jgi:hypothetical protein